MNAMRSIKRPGSHHCAGFSLLEMVVAVSILAIALAALYQAAGGATRNVRIDEKYAYAVELARSLLADNAMVPLAGVSSGGETAAGFQWRVDTQPVNLQSNLVPVGSLHEMDVRVSWTDGGKQREVVLNSVVQGFAL